MSQIGPKDWISRCGIHKCLHWAKFWRKTPGSVWASVSRLHIAWRFSSSRKTFEWGEPAVKRPKVNVSCRIHDKASRNTLNQPSFQGNSLIVSERPYLVCTLRNGDLDNNFGICRGSCIRNWSNRGARRCLLSVSTKWKMATFLRRISKHLIPEMFTVVATIVWTCYRHDHELS